MNNKELEKKQQKQKKSLNVVKWCCLGLLGGLLAFGFFGLLALGVKGCVNKQQLKQQQQESAQVFIPKALAPQKVVNNANQSGTTTSNSNILGLWEFLGESNEDVHQGVTYSWNYDVWESSGSQSIDYTYQVGVYMTSNVSLGRAHIEGLDLNKTIEVKYIGLAQDSIVLSSSANSSGINSSNTIYLYIQNMEQGYINKFSFDTYDFFTQTYLKSDNLTITQHYYTTGNTNLYVYDYFTKDNSIFTKIVNPPTYIGGNDGLQGAFSLLYKAFASIGDILQLNVLGGITLGTFIFIPLIVGLILFIVKLFKR